MANAPLCGGCQKVTTAASSFFRTTSDLQLVKQNAHKFFCDEAASMVAE